VSSDQHDAEGRFFVVRNLTKHFTVKKGILQRAVAHVHAVDDVSFEISRGQTLALVGESGCGKTTTARLIVQLDRPDSGELILEGKNMLGATGTALRSYRRDVQMVFQDPYSSLNPRKTVEQLIGEPLRIHRLCSGQALRERIAAMLDAVNLPADSMTRYPHEFSGGQRQRLGIARALTLNPKLIVCDEPVSALDVSIRSQILNLLMELQRDRDLTYLLIAHDLAVVEHVSDVVAVMYLGKIVEMAPTEELFANTVHPYSEALISAVPATAPSARKRRVTLSGDVPSPLHPPSGCRFRTRCPIAQARCAEVEPSLRESGPGHWVACHVRG
jgi:oligopeptide transport system ATP-binding protein